MAHGSKLPQDLASDEDVTLDTGVPEHNTLSRRKSMRRAIVFIILFCVAAWSAALLWLLG
jgi:hypothetical protein